MLWFDVNDVEFSHINGEINICSFFNISPKVEILASCKKTFNQVRNGFCITQSDIKEFR